MSCPRFRLEGSPKTVLFAGWDTFSTAHYHRYRTQALLAQLCGPKRVLLFPPSASRFLYLSPWYSVRSNHSRVPFDRQHVGNLLDDYPGLSRASCFLATLEPGQCLFIPDHWVHLVEGEGESLSLTIFWNDAFRFSNRMGFHRDGVSAGFKKSLALGAQVALKLRGERPLLDAASKLGIIEPSDRGAIMQYLGRFGAKRPVERNSSSTPV
ncbi:MAG: cupin-like domain-containing protein [Planctomycetota bacterium]|nr:cupin-like domain-containing protein [Planctomycetota bacterium]